MNQIPKNTESNCPLDGKCLYECIVYQAMSFRTMNVKNTSEELKESLNRGAIFTLCHLDKRNV